MATAFWNEYQTTNDIERACSKAVSYAATNPEILTYLGGPYHGEQSLWYKPENVCPFK
jgi:hypothetical protein